MENNKTLTNKGVNLILTFIIWLLFNYPIYANQFSLNEKKESFLQENSYNSTYNPSERKNVQDMNSFLLRGDILFQENNEEEEDEWTGPPPGDDLPDPGNTPVQDSFSMIIALSLTYLFYLFCRTNKQQKKGNSPGRFNKN